MAEKSNVPLKKRHNFGEINGSVSSLNEANDKPESNHDGSDEPSCIEVPDSSEENLQIEMRTLSNSLLLARAQKDRDRRMSRCSRRRIKDYDCQTNAGGSSTSSSLSQELTSSASDHDSASDHNERGVLLIEESDSEESDSTRYQKRNPDNSIEAEHYRRLLTEDCLREFELIYPPMTTHDRVQYWNLASEFIQIEDEFNLEFNPDENLKETKPLRSERLQKLAYRRPTIYSTTTRKSRKTKQKKTENVVPSKKTKTDSSPEESTKPKRKNMKDVWKNLQPSKRQAASAAAVAAAAVPTTPTQARKKPKVNQTKSNRVSPPQPPSSSSALLQPMPLSYVPPLRPRRPIVETRDPNEIPSAIKLRISYNKTPSPARMPNGTRYHLLDTSLNRTGLSCFNCSTNSSQFNASMNSPNGKIPISSYNQEEFYKYLGIDTNPPQEKTSPEPQQQQTLTTDTNQQQQQRRSLRVFIQQKQMESINRSNEDLRKTVNNGKTTRKSHSLSPIGNRSVSNWSLNVQKSSMETLNTTSHIQQRRSYDLYSSQTSVAGPSKLNGANSTLYNGNSMRCDAKENPLSKSTPNLAAMSTANEQHQQQQQQQQPNQRPVQRVIRRRASLLPSPMMLDEIFKRYKKCLRQGFAITRQLSKKVRKKDTEKATTSKSTDQVMTTDSKQNCDENVVNKKEETTTTINNQTNEIRVNDHMKNSNSLIVNDVAHTNGLSNETDEVVHMNGVEYSEPTITVDATKSLEWQKGQLNNSTDINKSQIRNPLNMKNGKVLAILTHSRAANQDDVLVVVQENAISYWQRMSRVMGMFGLTRNWNMIGETERITRRDFEVPALYQHRLIDYGGDFPVYVELRAKESAADNFRQCCLSFMYLHVYFVEAGENNKPIIKMECINLDTVKGFANSINYIALKRAPSFLMTWTERNVNNQTRCGIVKYTFRSPNFDKIVDIFDYSYLQHDIKTLYELNDRHVVGCGDRTISMWDHVNGRLLIDFEIDLPTIGRNIGCFTVGVDQPEYMLLIQLMSSDEHPDKENLLKVMAVQTVDPYNWRTLQTFDIPTTFGQIQSIFDNDNMLTISFTSGTFILLNILSPHTIYVRNMNWDNQTEPNQPLLKNTLNGSNNSLSTANNGKIFNANTNTKQSIVRSIQLFPQPNGQMIEIHDNYVMTKSIWEYFVEK